MGLKLLILTLLVASCSSGVQSGWDDSDILFEESGDRPQEECWAKPTDPKSLQYQACPFEKSPCEGQTFVVANEKDCEQLVRQKGCAAATVVPVSEGGLQSSDNQPLLHCTLLLKDNAITPAKNNQFNVRRNVTEILYFKVRQGAEGPTAADAFLTGAFSREIFFPRTNAVFPSTRTYYKSPLWQLRRALGAERVSQVMYGNLGKGPDECRMTFNNAYEENGSWFRKENLVQSSPFRVDFLQARPYHVFSILGDNRPNILNRQFITAHYGGCENDVGYMMVLAMNDACVWGKSDSKFPRFICSANADPNNRETGYPNLNQFTNYMRDFELRGVLPRPVTFIYAGESEN